MASDWPADPDAMQRAREFLLEHGRRATLLPDGDTDGLSAGVLLERSILPDDERAAPFLLRKGESVFSDAARERLAAQAPDAIVLLDQGSRGERVLPGRPQLVIDHHTPRGFPPGALACSAFGHEPIATSSVLTWELVRGIADVSELAWLAALGAVGDLGPSAPFDVVKPALDRFGRKSISEAIALLNAPRRSAEHDVEIAWEVLRNAESPRAVASGTDALVRKLRERRAEVQAELARCSFAAPSFAGKLALVHFSSPAKVHPLLAKRWSSRLKGYSVLAANTGYLPDRINFSMRTGTSEDLIALLRRHAPADAPEFAHGHVQATGGSLRPEQFQRLLQSLGFAPKVQAAVEESAPAG